MSNQTRTPDTNPVITIADPALETTAPVEEKQSFVRKTKHFVQTHRRPALAAAGLVGLTVVAAVAGRKTAPSREGVYLELGPVEVVDGEVLAEQIENDTETA